MSAPAPVRTEMRQPSPQDAALKLAAEGIPVFPCNAKKKPLTPHGFKDASTDAETVRQWWTEWPFALIGMPTGAASGIFGLDVDVKRDADGNETLSALGSLPLTLAYRTQSGGAHHLFTHPRGAKLSNTAGELGPGLDTRGDGGYVIRWDMHGCSVLADEPLADVPEWLLEKLTEKPRSSPNGHDHAASEAIPQGRRNATLTSMAGLMRRRGMTPAAVEAALVAENEARCVPPLDDAEVRRIAASVARYEPERAADDAPRAEHIRAVDLRELAQRQFKPRECLLSPWLHSQDLAMLYGKRGTGKTHFAMALAFATATGRQFLQWRAERPRKVLYLDGELPGSVLQSRVLLHLPDPEPAEGFFRVFTPDLLGLDDTLPDIATRDGQDIINGMIEDDTALVVLDNLSAWARGNRAENDAESWLPIADWALALRRRGIAVLIVHHAGKGGDQRGTSKREDLLDCVIRLERPADYEAREGARFSVNFTKARHLHGDDAEGLEVTMRTDHDRATWEWVTSEQDTYRRVTELAKEGMSQADIATELGKNRSTICRHLKKAKAALA